MFFPSEEKLGGIWQGIWSLCLLNLTTNRPGPSKDKEWRSQNRDLMYKWCQILVQLNAFPELALLWATHCWALTLLRNIHPGAGRGKIEPVRTADKSALIGIIHLHWWVWRCQKRGWWTGPGTSVRSRLHGNSAGNREPGLHKETHLQLLSLSAFISSPLLHPHLFIKWLDLSPPTLSDGSPRFWSKGKIKLPVQKFAETQSSKDLL